MKAQLAKVIPEAKDTKTFIFDMPKDIHWLPGQFFYLTLPGEFTDYRGPTRQFTNAASPTEGSVYKVTTRIRDESNYKQTLANLKIGTVVDTEGPSGTFILDENEPGNHVFLAGGAGITPFLSFLQYAYDTKRSDDLLLLYSNKAENEIAFKKEFDMFASQKNVKVIYTLSREKKKGFENGRLDETLISKYSKSISKPTFWICGPPAFTSAMETLLRNMKVDSDKIRSEKFTGY